MRHPAVLSSLFLAIAIVLCTWSVSDALKSFGKSLEKAAELSRDSPPHIPSTFTIRFGGENGNPLHVISSDK